MGKHYVNNKELYTVMQEYISKVREAEDSGSTLPRVPDHVGRALVQIANRLVNNIF